MLNSIPVIAYLSLDLPISVALVFTFHTCYSYLKSLLLSNAALFLLVCT